MPRAEPVVVSNNQLKYIAKNNFGVKIHEKSGFTLNQGERGKN
jgi:hypothetical protein